MNCIAFNQLIQMTQFSLENEAKLISELSCTVSYCMSG